jgi:hypothetical protein
MSRSIYMVHYVQDISDLILIVQGLTSHSCIAEIQSHVVVCNRTHDYPTTLFLGLFLSLFA